MSFQGSLVAASLRPFFVFGSYSFGSLVALSANPSQLLKDVPVGLCFRRYLSRRVSRSCLFCLTSVPSSFSYFMSYVFMYYLNKFMVIYLEDILIFFKSEEEHVEHLRPFSGSFMIISFMPNSPSANFG